MALEAHVSTVYESLGTIGDALDPTGYAVLAFLSLPVFPRVEVGDETPAYSFRVLNRVAHPFHVADERRVSARFYLDHPLRLLGAPNHDVEAPLLR